MLHRMHNLYVRAIKPAIWTGASISTTLGAWCNYICPISLSLRTLYARHLSQNASGTNLIIVITWDNGLACNAIFDIFSAWFPVHYLTHTQCEFYTLAFDRRFHWHLVSRRRQLIIRSPAAKLHELFATISFTYINKYEYAALIQRFMHMIYVDAFVCVPRRWWCGWLKLPAGEQTPHLHPSLLHRGRVPVINYYNLIFSSIRCKTQIYWITLNIIVIRARTDETSAIA